MRLVYPFLVFSLFSFGCSAVKEASESFNETEIILFKSYDEPDASSEKVLDIDRRITFDINTPVDQVLDSVTKYLERNFFTNYSSFNEKSSPIKIELKEFNIVKSENYNFRLAVFNISDPEEIAVQNFFQGSTGAQHTYAVLLSNILQPHLSHPLLDGVIILYNDKVLRDLDHINLEGIIVPANVNRFVWEVLKR
jgi:hypothetical protein